MGIETAVALQQRNGATGKIVFQEGATMYGYGRASTAKQQITVASQKEIVEAYYRLRKAAGEDWLWGGYYPDADCTSHIPWLERPMGHQLFLASKPGDVIVVSHFDRAFRSVLDCHNSISALIEKRVGLILLDIDVDTTKPLGRAFLKIMAVIKELERDEISRRVREAAQQTLREGRPYTPKGTPFGWTAKRNPESRKIEYAIDAPARQLGREIIRLYFEREVSVASMPKYFARMKRRYPKKYAKVYVPKNESGYSVALRLTLLQFPILHTGEVPPAGSITPVHKGRAAYINPGGCVWRVSPTLDLSIYERCNAPVHGAVDRLIRTLFYSDPKCRARLVSCGAARILGLTDS